MKRIMLLLVIMLAMVSIAATNDVQNAKRPVKVTSDNTYYDRKEGIAVFSGKVHVDDEEYQMHADKAYLFMTGTNDLKRLVAVGNVALTNGNRRAYGAKASYYRQNGLVILYAPTNGIAEVREEMPDGQEPRTLTGSVIRFWTNSEQVEVVKSVIKGTRSDASGKEALSGGLGIFGK